MGSRPMGLFPKTRLRDCWRQQFVLAATAALTLTGAASADPYSSKTYPRSAAKKLVVETDAGPIALNQALDGPTSVDVTPAAPGDDCRVTQDLRGGVLKLSARAPKPAAYPLAPKRPCSAGFKIVGWFEDVSVRSGSGDITFGMSSHKADLRTGSGALHVDASVADLRLRSGSGTVSGRAPVAKLDVETGSGDVGLTGLTGLVRARSGSGAVSLDWDKAPASGLIEVETGSGGLEALFPKGTRLKTSLRSATGRMKDDFDDKDARLKLNFRSGSGGATLTRKP